MSDPVLQVFQQADTLLNAQLAATLAGLTLAALTFLTLRLGETRVLVIRSAGPNISIQPEKEGEKAGTDQQVAQKLSDIQKGATDFYKTFYLFLLSLVLMLVVFDTALQPLKNDVAIDMASVGVTGAPFAGGLILLVQGTKKIKKHFLTPATDAVTVPSQQSAP